MRGCFKIVVFAACTACLGAGGSAVAGVCPPSSHLVMLPQGPACVAGRGAQAQRWNKAQRRGGCQAPWRVVRLPRGLYCLNPRQIAILRQKFAKLRQRQQLAQQNSGRGPQVFMPSGMKVFMPSPMKVFVPSPMKPIGPPGPPSPTQANSNYGTQVGNKIDPEHKGLNPAQVQWMNTVGHDMMNSGWSGSGWQYQ